jgi:diacylglycerol kinase (ATP)
MKIAVIWNPAAGTLGSRRRAKQFRQRWQGRVTWFDTQSLADVGEAVGEAMEQGCSILAAAGGDGTVHAVANALLLLPEASRITLAVVPVGTANDYAYSLEQQFGVCDLDDDTSDRVDVGQATKESTGETQYFVESLGLGVSGNVAAAARGIRRLSGRLRYGLAAVRVIRRGLVAYPLHLQWDEDDQCTEETLMLTLLLGQREGNMVFARDARLDDGLFSTVLVSQCSVWEALRLLPTLLVRGVPESHPSLKRGLAGRLRVGSKSPLSVHIDGEPFCDDAADTRELVVDLLPKRLAVKVCRC